MKGREEREGVEGERTAINTLDLGELIELGLPLLYCPSRKEMSPGRRYCQWSMRRQ